MTVEAQLEGRVAIEGHVLDAGIEPRRARFDAMDRAIARIGGAERIGCGHSVDGETREGRDDPRIEKYVPVPLPATRVPGM